MIQAHLDQLRTVRARTLAMIQNLSQEQLDYLPAPGDWSVGEVVDHLILAEQFVRQDIAILVDRAKAGDNTILYRSFAEFNARPAFIPEPFLAWLEPSLNLLNSFAPACIREYIVRNVPIPALAPDATLPQSGKSKAGLVDGLGSALQETEALFATNPHLDYGRMRHQHPLFGIQTVPQLLRTLTLHEQAHQEQITKVLSNPQCPVAP